MGEVLRDATRDADVPGRYGGEEFIVLLPECDIDGAVATAERIRARLAEEVFNGGKVTASLGAAEYPTHGETPRELIAAADVALYEAKQQGRDRVVAAKTAGGVPGAGEKPKRGAAARRSPAAKKKATGKKAAAKKKPAAKKKGSGKKES